jgi:hypothetical protein
MTDWGVFSMTVCAGDGEPAERSFLINGKKCNVHVFRMRSQFWNIWYNFSMTAWMIHKWI